MKKKNNDPPFILLLLPLSLLVLLAYGLLLTKLGFYWDDWPYVWTRLELGYSGLLRHFSFSRPVAGQLHNIAILITQGSPLLAQIYVLIAQVFGSFCAALLVKTVWKEKNFAAALTGLLFLAYPGFTMRPIAINFSFSYFLMGALFLSFILTIKAAREPEHRILRIVIAAAIALLNLFASEYFFLLELLRPFFLAAALADDREGSAVKKSLRFCIPFAAVFLCGVLYRMFFNQTQTLHYDFKLLEDLKAAPLTTIFAYIAQMFRDSFRVTFAAWGTVFEFPNAAEFGSRSTWTYRAICAAGALCAFLSLLLFGRKKERAAARENLFMLGIGALAVLLAGQPFWLTESSIGFVFQNSRYTLPFMLGVSLILSALLDFIRRPRWVPALGAALFIGLAAGHLFVTGNEYRRDWTLTKDFFSQMTWRIPGIEADTVVVTNQLPIRFSTDNSLTAPLNWIYARDYADERIPYILYTNTKRENTLSSLEPGHEVFQEYLSAQFFGSTDDMISIYYNAPGCVHVLDPEVDIFNQMIPEIDREGAVLNNYSRILTDADAAQLPKKVFGEEAARGWCWYYESADLARQRGDWETAAELGDTAFGLDDHPNDPMERIPFIEAYAHVGRTEDALAQTREALAVTPVMNDPLCALWNRITRETGAEPGDLLSCDFLKSGESHE